MHRLLFLLCHAVACALLRSYRFRAVGEPPAGGPYILAIWHQNLFAGILAQSARPHVVMVSRSRHADPLDYALGRLGHVVVRGSSRRGTRDKGGRQAKDEMIDVLMSGLPGAVTVDGPKGPAREAKPGIVDMAMRTGLPIVPYAALAERYWSFPTWDAFRLPKPFTTIHVHYGAPLRIDARATPRQFDDMLIELGKRITALDDGPLRPRRRWRTARRRAPLGSA
ncbi:lysophospholipid acyltransferase family protein [Solimonas soli]|uniref:lysophospholipid acyltransferase family protein n=1 Tax=Solimonas soli TaxID=413479 RepID=UPI0004837E6D|nr:lysophospholipid acyltransferase family protein [Solimonas soli]